MIDVSVGIGKNSDARLSAMDAANQAITTLQNKRADCALVFGSSSLDQEMILKGLKEVINGTPIIGCSSAYEITSEGLASEGSVVVILFYSDQIKFSTGFGTHIEWNAKNSGKDCAQTIDPTATDVLVFANLLPSNAEKSINGILEKINKEITIIAGGAADNLRFFETNQYFNFSSYSDAVVALGLSGMFSSAYSSTNGFLPVGVLKKITKLSDNVIEEIDNEPAIKLYEDYFGDEYKTMLEQGKLMSFAASYPFGIYETNSNKALIRIPTFIDKDSGKIFFGGSIPKNDGFRLMISDKRQNTKTATEAAKELVKNLNGKKPKLVLMISSVARRKVVGDAWSDEIKEVQEVVGIDVPIAGFYGFAEYAGKGTNNTNVTINNGSLVLWAISE